PGLETARRSLQGPQVRPISRATWLPSRDLSPLLEPSISVSGLNREGAMAYDPGGSHGLAAQEYFCDSHMRPHPFVSLNGGFFSCPDEVIDHRDRGQSMREEGPRMRKVADQRRAPSGQDPQDLLRG